MLKIDLNIDLIFDHRTSDLTGNHGVRKPFKNKRCSVKKDQRVIIRVIDNL
jgi:hypothetical protein